MQKLTSLTSVHIKRTSDCDKSLPLPQYQTLGASGIDLRANIFDDGKVNIPPLHHAIIPTGLCFEIPMGYEGQVRPRSGLAAKNAVTVLNSPGTIDSDYRGEIKIILHNTDPHKHFFVNHGDRIAQLVFAPVERVCLIEVDSLDKTKREDGHFGSTGVH